MSEQDWQLVQNKKTKSNKQVQEIAKPFDPIISRQKETQAKLNAIKQESKQIKYNESTNSNQDWNTIMIGKSQPKQKVSQLQKIPSAIKETEPGSVVKIKKVSKLMAKAIVDARIVKQWTQIQLAHNSNIDVKTIGEIENATSVYDSNIFNKITKALGIKIERNYDLV